MAEEHGDSHSEVNISHISAEEIKATENQESQIPGVSFGELVRIREAERATEEAVALPRPLYREWITPGYGGGKHIIHGAYDVDETHPKNPYYSARERANLRLSMVQMNEDHSAWGSRNYSDGHEHTTFSVPVRFLTPKLHDILLKDYASESVRYYLYQEEQTEYGFRNAQKTNKAIVKGLEINGDLIFYETNDEMMLHEAELELKEKYRNKHFDKEQKEIQKSAVMSLQNKAMVLRAETK